MINELAKLIREMGEVTRKYANQFDEIAELLEKTGNLDYVSEAVENVTNMLVNLRLIRLVQRLSKMKGN